MKVKVTSSYLDDEDIKMVIDVEATRSELEKCGSNGHYSKPLAENISEKIAEAVAKEWLELHKVEVMNGIDIDKIISGVQLKIVEGFSLNRG